VLIESKQVVGIRDSSHEKPDEFVKFLIAKLNAFLLFHIDDVWISIYSLEAAMEENHSEDEVHERATLRKILFPEVVEHLPQIVMGVHLRAYSDTRGEVLKDD